MLLHYVLYRTKRTLPTDPPFCAAIFAEDSDCAEAQLQQHEPGADVVWVTDQRDTPSARDAYANYYGNSKDGANVSG